MYCEQANSGRLYCGQIGCLFVAADITTGVDCTVGWVMSTVCKGQYKQRCIFYCECVKFEVDNRAISSEGYIVL